MENRIIKFRARNAELPRCFVYGYFVIENGECFIINDEGRFIVIAGTENQFTGLKDINNNDIYEGDIVEYFVRKTRCIGEIGWATISYWIIGQLDRLNWIAHWKIAVIGNIYDNPELINK